MLSRRAGLTASAALSCSFCSLHAPPILKSRVGVRTKNAHFRRLLISFLADSTNARAIVTVLRLSVCLSVTLCIVAKRCVLEQKLLLTAYRNRI